MSVKPHASPVLHAIEYLLGRLDRALPDDAPGIRRPPVVPEPDEGSLPGRLLDRLGRDRLGCAALRRAREPLRRDALRHGTGGRFISLLGDAELDEGNLWEAMLEPQTRGLGNVLWIVDLNRQSLDRVVPIIKAQRARESVRGRTAGRCSS